MQLYSVETSLSASALHPRSDCAAKVLHATAALNFVNRPSCSATVDPYAAMGESYMQ